VKTSSGAVDTFNSILGRMDELVTKSGEVALSMQEQDTTAHAILRNAGELSALSEDNARGVAQTASQGESLAESARELETACGHSRSDLRQDACPEEAGWQLSAGFSSS
jgi:methyl-accepting chemotaxis protein